MTTTPLLRRLPTSGHSARARLHFMLDGQPAEGAAGDTVLTAVLALGAQVRQHDVDGTPRAGFCAIGACQDCWMSLADGRRLRACTTPLEAGMALLTDLPR